MRHLITLAVALLPLSSVSAQYVPPVPAADRITLTWDHESPDVGFRLYFGTAPGVYTERRTIGTGERSVTIEVSRTDDYYLVLTAVDALGMESLPTPELAVRVVDAEQPFPVPPGWNSVRRTKTLTVSATETLEKGP